MAEVGWSEERLARNVNDLAAATGTSLRLDRRSVAHWLAGRPPEQPVPTLVAEALSRGLGRLVTVAATGLDPGRPADAHTAGQEGTHSDVHVQDAVTALADLAEFGDAQRGSPAGGVHGPAESTAPSRPQAAGGASVRIRTISPERVPAVEAMVRVYSDLDEAFGGGHSRRALAAYLAGGLAPRLRGSGDDQASRSRIWSAAIRLTYRCGFMCFDEELHGLAQRYYRVALDLASEAGDAAAYAIVLRTMSHQARLLGHRRHAVHLAEAAVVTGGRAMPPARSAFLLGQVAVAAAGAGDKTNAVASLSSAERQLNRATSLSATDGSADAAMGGYHHAALAHQQAAVQALLGDRAGAITALTTSIRHRPAKERRARAVTLARLAELQLSQGELEQAVSTWHAFLNDHRHLRSGRATTALNIMRSRLAPYAANVDAAQLLTRAPADDRLRAH
ncbi:hypothetical protein [Thermomonospora umbrina]|uniref:hypothetical protein n=1 Tax=Thermomonospora umbrina TaxID=111806 RepID=UPI001B881AED|nr:hypothetical protein [Thermomonospora umbrina]